MTVPADAWGPALNVCLPTPRECSTTPAAAVAGRRRRHPARARAGLGGRVRLTPVWGPPPPPPARTRRVNRARWPRRHVVGATRRAAGAPSGSARRPRLHAGYSHCRRCRGDTIPRRPPRRRGRRDTRWGGSGSGGRRGASRSSVVAGGTPRPPVPPPQPLPPTHPRKRRVRHRLLASPARLVALPVGMIPRPEVGPVACRQRLCASSLTRARPGGPDVTVGRPMCGGHQPPVTAFGRPWAPLWRRARPPRGPDRWWPAPAPAHLNGPRPAALLCRVPTQRRCPPEPSDRLQSPLRHGTDPTPCGRNLRHRRRLEACLPPHQGSVYILSATYR